MLALTLAVPVAGCTGPVCTAVGALTGFVVTVPASEGTTVPTSEVGLSTPAAPADTVTVSICLEDDCRETRPPVVTSPWLVPDDRLTGTDPVRLSITVRPADGPAVAGTGVVAPRLSQPNGPGCGDAFQADVTLPGDGTLTQTN